MFPYSFSTKLLHGLPFAPFAGVDFMGGLAKGLVNTFDTGGYYLTKGGALLNEGYTTFTREMNKNFSYPPPKEGIYTDDEIENLKNM